MEDIKRYVAKASAAVVWRPFELLVCRLPVSRAETWHWGVIGGY
jgi:hypothetical protein